MSLTKPLAKYPHIRKAGAFYFLAGQGCRDPDTNECAGLHFDGDQLAGYDIAVQAKGVLNNLDRVLRSVGLDKAHLIDVTVFLTSMQDFDIMNAVWNDHFGDCAPGPTRTTVAVSQLPGHNFIEMKAVAWNPEA